MRKASPNDIPLLVDLMAEFYAEGGYDLNRARAAEAGGSYAHLIAIINGALRRRHSAFANRISRIR